MSDSIRGLTLWRPWAWAVTRGSKRIENRPWWHTSILGQYIAIHAGKTWDYDGAKRIIEAHPEMPGSAGAHPLGIVGVARVAEAIDYEAMRDGYDGDPGTELPAGLSWDHHGRWMFGPWCWVLDDVVAIDPVPSRGAQGLWPLPDDVLATVRERWQAARGAT